MGYTRIDLNQELAWHFSVSIDQQDLAKTNMSLQRKWPPGKSERLRLYACVYGLAVLVWYVIYANRVSYPAFPVGGPGDFTSFYAAGQLIAKGEAARLYDLQLQSETQRQLLAANDALGPRSVFLPYNYPPFFALLFVPMSYLRMPWAFYLWNTLNAGLLLASIWLVWYHGEADSLRNYLLASLLALSFVPVLAALDNGQSSLILLFAITLTFLALKSRRDLLAGAALAMGLVKPQLVLLILAVLIYCRRWRVLLGFATASAALLLMSLLIVGKDGLTSYVAVLRLSSAWDGASGIYPALMPNLRGTVYRLGQMYSRWSGAKASVPVLGAITISLTSAVFVLTMRAWRACSSRESPRFELLVAFTLAGALLVSPHLNLQDVSLLVLGAVLLIREAPSCHAQEWRLPLAGTGHVTLFVALFLLSGPARAQLAALLLVAFMLASYIELKRRKGTDDHNL